jgi:phosphatidylinositol kinase/protein kinase (PI-3  family)
MVKKANENNLKENQLQKSLTKPRDLKKDKKQSYVYEKPVQLPINSEIAASYG